MTSPQARESARHFAVLSRVDAIVLDLSAPERTSAAPLGSCSICDAALRGHAPPVAADPIHAFAAYQAERLGGRYVYVCPHGLLHIAAPVIAQDSLDEVLVCGPAVLGAVDEEAVRALRASPVGSLLPPDAVSAWIDALVRLAPDEATSLSHVLRSVALSLCDADGADYLRRNRSEDAGRDVAGYLDYLSTMEGDLTGAPRYPVATERRLLDRVSAGDREGACVLLEQIVGAVESVAGDEVDDARSRVLELAVLLSRAAIAGGADAEEVFGLEYRSLIRLRSLTNVGEILVWLRRILRRFVDLVFDLRHVRYSAHLSRALGFVREHFREPIQLGDAAAAAGVTPGYLGRIIRTQLHTTYSRYLTSLRLQAAKRLLRSTRLPVGEVGARCGYSDQSYFAQTFRRESGYSPTEYRSRA